MQARRRKTLVVCHRCHNDITAIVIKATDLKETEHSQPRRLGEVPRPDRTTIINRFRADMARLQRIVSAIPATQRFTAVIDNWTIEEILIHIAAWDRELLRAVDELLAGKKPAYTKITEDEFNARAVAENRGVSFTEAFAEMKAAHEALLRGMNSLSDEEWLFKSKYRWGRRLPMTVESLFTYAYKGETHYGGHATEIEDWLRKA